MNAETKMSPAEARDFPEAGVTLKLIMLHQVDMITIRSSQCAIAVCLLPTMRATADALPAMIINDVINVRAGDKHFAFDLEGRLLDDAGYDEKPKMLAWRTWHNAWRVLDPRVASMLNGVDDRVEGEA